MAWTNVLPGSGFYPDILLEWDPTTPPTDANVVWNDITDRLRGWDWGYGRNDELASFEAGTGSVVLDNRDRAFDPSFGDAVALTVSGNEITDLSRMGALAGDGLTSDSSFGIWEATTNLIANGGFETNTTGWAGYATGTVSRDSTVAKFGTASLKTVAAAIGDGAVFNITVAASTTYTVSAWVYATAGGSFDMSLTDGIDQALTGPLVVIAPSTWTRVPMTGVTDAHTARAVLIRAYQAGTFYIDGVQVEAKPIATPYVHTDGGTAARAAATVQAPASLLTNTQGWFAARLRVGFASTDATERDVAMWENAGNTEHYKLMWKTTGTWSLRRRTASTNVDVDVGSQTFVLGDMVTLVAGWAGGNIFLSVNGAAFVTSAASAANPAAATFGIGYDPVLGTRQIDADVLWFAAGTGTLTNADAATLHAQGNLDPGTGLLPAASVSTFVWAANDSNGSNGSPYAGNIKPRKPFRLRARVASITEYPVFIGYARGYPQTYPAAGYDSLVKVDLVDAYAILQSQDLYTGFTRPAELTGARITALLDAVGIPAAARDIDPGTVTVAAIDITSPGTSALDHARAVAIDSELGQFFLAKDGKVTFHDYTRRLNGSTLQTFTDEVGDDRPYGIAPEPTFDETYLWNYIIATGAGGDDTAQVAEDAASQTDYFTLTKTVATELVIGSEIQQVADRYILRYAQPQLRVPSLPLNGAMNPSILWSVILDLEVSDRIAFERFAPRLDQMTLWLWVEGIRHTCKPGGPWLTEIATSPADLNPYLVLDHATRGELDYVNVLA